LQGNVSFLGRLDQRQLVEAYAGCSLVASASRQETAPMALAQALATGRPVVATRVGGIPWLVDDGITGFLVDVGDVRALADRLAELLANDCKRRQMGASGSRVAQERFGPDIVARSTVQVYQTVAHRNHC
jgi:glycosyltransferase involved in cell wall biosynthesis